MSIPLKPHENRVRMLIRIAMSAINLSMSAIYLKEKEGMNAILGIVLYQQVIIYKLYKRTKGQQIKRTCCVIITHDNNNNRLYCITILYLLYTSSLFKIKGA